MAGNTILYLTLAVSFITVSIATAGLAATQNACGSLHATDKPATATEGVNGFSGSLLICGQVFRYWWYVIAYEYVAFFAVLITTLLGGLKRQRASWMGLYAVGALLFISMTEAFLTLQDVTWYHTKPTMAHKSRVVTAGALMTAIVNIWLSIYLGKAEEHDSAKTDAEEKVITI